MMADFAIPVSPLQKHPAYDIHDCVDDWSWDKVTISLFVYNPVLLYLSQ